MTRIINCVRCRELIDIKRDENRKIQSYRFCDKCIVEILVEWLNNNPSAWRRT